MLWPFIASAQGIPACRAPSHGAEHLRARFGEPEERYDAPAFLRHRCFAAACDSDGGAGTDSSPLRSIRLPQHQGHPANGRDRRETKGTFREQEPRRCKMPSYPTPSTADWISIANCPIPESRFLACSRPFFFSLLGSVLCRTSTRPSPPSLFCASASRCPIVRGQDRITCGQPPNIPAGPCSTSGNEVSRDDGVAQMGPFFERRGRPDVVSHSV